MTRDSKTTYLSTLLRRGARPFGDVRREAQGVTPDAARAAESAQAPSDELADDGTAVESDAVSLTPEDVDYNGESTRTHADGHGRRWRETAGADYDDSDYGRGRAPSDSHEREKRSPQSHSTEAAAPLTRFTELIIPPAVAAGGRSVSSEGAAHGGQQTLYRRAGDDRTEGAALTGTRASGPEAQTASGEEYARGSMFRLGARDEDEGARAESQGAYGRVGEPANSDEDVRGNARAPVRLYDVQARDETAFAATRARGGAREDGDGSGDGGSPRLVINQLEVRIVDEPPAPPVVARPCANTAGARAGSLDSLDRRNLRRFHLGP